MNIREYFSITVSKQRKDEDPVNATELQNPIHITMQKPAGEDTDCVVHYHDGKVEILKDIGNEEDAITIETASFSPYAFAFGGGKAAPKFKMTIPLIAGAVAIIALLSLLIVLLRRKKGRRDNPMYQSIEEATTINANDTNVENAESLDITQENDEPKGE